jgi:hypothetical protein
MIVCVVDYLGYRLLATSMLPIGKGTLISGSSDGGMTGISQYLAKLTASLFL